MPLKAWVARHAGHEVRVINTWFSGAHQDRAVHDPG